MYNTLEMLSEIWYTYDDGTREKAYSYTYNADGTLAKLDNHLEGTSIEYRYDNNGRLKSITDTLPNDLSYTKYYSVNYNENNLVSSQTYSITYSSTDSGVATYRTTSYDYNTKGYLVTETLEYLSGDPELNYTYDNFGRISSAYIDLGDLDYTEQYTYVSEGNNTSYLVDSYTSTVGNSSTTYNYTYDSKGNITKIVLGNKIIRYVYDNLGQLIREDNGQLNKTYTYTYDNAGNITSKNTYSLTAEGVTPTSPTSTINYGYSDDGWGDMLTSYGGIEITYDEIGNPLSYYNGSSYTFTWTGRQLTGAVKGSATMSFTYNDEGIRTSKTINGVKHTYYIVGSTIMGEEWGDKIILYLYDAAGSPIGMMFRKTSYKITDWDLFWYEKNLHGDIVAVYNAFGTKLATYIYDAWGNHSITYTNGGASTAAYYNPFRYRGYYYDTDLGMYYLQSRYYNPNTCRFINADSYVSTGQGILGNNMYAYCGNNPVNYYDPTGENADILMRGWGATAWWLTLLDGALPIGDIIFWGVFGTLAVASVLNSAQNKTPEKSKDKPQDPPSSVQNPEDVPPDVEVPDVKYPGNDPSVAPDGYEWRGKGPQGSKEGSYYNPETDTSLHPDLRHPDPIGPHWDYNGPEGEFRIFPDGSIKPK